jgi:DNA polymerase-3 subunit epsilon
MSSILSIVDVETTGLRPGEDRIIEIGIIRVAENKVVERYQQLINPERSLPYFIEQHTGITSDMVATAPTFSEIMPTIKPLLDGCIFTAHNAGFDYSFIQSEYRREGEVYMAPRLCTVQLSRRLFPGHRRHNLDAIMQRFNIPCPTRHRALDDAEVVWQFLQQLKVGFQDDDFLSVVRG